MLLGYLLLLLTAQLLLGNLCLRRHGRSSCSKLLIGDNGARSRRRRGSSYTLRCLSLALILLHLYLRRCSPTILLCRHQVHSLLHNKVRLLLVYLLL